MKLQQVATTTLSNCSSCCHIPETSPIFGSLNSLDNQLVTWSILIIIGSVVVLNFVISNLFKIATDTPFELLLRNIEHELMLVGVTAFFFKIFISFYPNIPHDWHAALEYADVLIPIVAFSYCLQGLLLIFMTINQTNLWINNYHLSLEELLNKFYYLMNHKTRSLKLMWRRYVIQEQMRFRIYGLIFCDQYRLVYSSLAFDRYVLGVYEKYLMEVIEIDEADWAMVSFCILLSLFRSQYIDFTGYVCADGDTACFDLASVKAFTCVGKFSNKSYMNS